ncbi:MAG: serine/threonine protein kinase, partial [Gammaproteobacteria bacterium]|nr:serine/threonine protein kinase [Gammaproteobacteria bacterium]
MLKALAKDPARRYASAKELADDLGRYLEQRPVRARPDSAGYRFTRFVRRNRVVATAVAVVVLSLVSGVAVSAWQAAAARRAQERAEQALRQSE